MKFCICQTHLVNSYLLFVVIIQQSLSLLRNAVTGKDVAETTIYILNPKEQPHQSEKRKIVYLIIYFDIKAILTYKVINCYLSLDRYFIN